MAELSVRYATALFDLSRESGMLGKCVEQAVVVRDALLTSECRGIMEHPHISSDEKRAFIREVFTDELDVHLNSFLNLLITKNRENIMALALTTFIDMGNRVGGRAKADVASAAPLDEAQISTLQAVLSNKLGRQVDVTVRVDPSLIGGLYIYADGHYMDCTVRKQLMDMKTALRMGRD